MPLLIAMAFEKFEAPFEEVELLGCRDLFCGEKLMLDLVEYERGSRVEASPPGTPTSEPAYLIGPGESSRVWRITFERPFVVRVRDQTLGSRKAQVNLPGRCCFSQQSEWLDEFVFDQRLGHYTPTHYIFDLIDNFIEIIGDDWPTIEELSRGGGSA